MGSCRWTIQLEDGAHTLALEHGYWSGTRRITVDGQLTQVRRNLFLRVWAVGSRDVIPVGGHTCEVQVQPNFRTNGYDYYLLVDGKPQAPGPD